MVLISKTGYGDWSERVIVKSGTTLQVNADLGAVQTAAATQPGDRHPHNYHSENQHEKGTRRPGRPRQPRLHSRHDGGNGSTRTRFVVLSRKY